MKAATLALITALLVSAGPIAVPGHFGSPAASTPVVGSATAGAYFDYLVIILMENRNECEILTSCGGAAPYLTNLASAYGLASEDHYCGVNPSLPNYLCLSGGSDFGCNDYDGSPNSNACTAQAWNAANIVDRLTASGLTWKAYMENMPSNCYGADSSDGQYAVRHDPFVYYSDIVNDSTRCAQVVPAGNSDSALLNDLGSASTASNYMWLTPNKCNDMHSCSVSAGDTYLSGLVPKILDSSVFTTKRAALFITFDEGYDEPIYTVWAGPVVKPGYLSSFSYNHFSLLATVEANWNLAPLTANDRDAPNMAEFFTGEPSRGVSVAPAGSLPLVLIGGIAAVAAVAVLVGLLILRRRGGTRKSPSPIDDFNPDEDEIEEL